MSMSATVLWSGTEDALTAAFRAFFVSSRFFQVATMLCCCFSSGDLGEAQSLRQGVSAFNRQDYQAGVADLHSAGRAGQAAAQAYLGFMFETGRGVPQNYTEAAMWYRRAAEQGDSLAQFRSACSMTKGRACRAISSKPANGSISRPRRSRAGHGKRARDPRCRNHQDDPRRDRAGTPAGAGMGADPRTLSDLTAADSAAPRHASTKLSRRATEA